MRYQPLAETRESPSIGSHRRKASLSITHFWVLREGRTQKMITSETPTFIVFIIRSRGE